MATKSVNSKNSEEVEEPSIDSVDPEECKLARRLRIQRRAEALQRLENDDGGSEEKESLTEKQICISAELLEKLINEGYEVITNVQVANDARELERQKRESALQDLISKHLKENREESERQCEIINKQWPLILALKDPLEINNAMELQAKKCKEVLDLKDAFIAELKQELERADRIYFENQKQQKDDIKLLMERIENQMLTMENAYNRELQLIEKALETERETIVENFQKKWEDLYQKEQDEDYMSDEKLKEIMEDYETEMEKLMTEHDEDYRAQKILLNKECQLLQQEVEKTKAMCLLNAEKLSYNYTVMKNREEENAIIKSQQKRKINKLQVHLDSLKQNYKILEANTNMEIEKLSNQIIKYRKNITELLEKSNHFTRISEKQYLDIWDMNTQTANELVDKILMADRIIHERTLGILWEAPKKSLPKKEDLPSYREAMNIIKMRKQKEVELNKIFQYKRADQSCSEIKLETQVLHNILKQISNSSKYLIEHKLQEIILDRCEEDKTIIQLDNIFQALSISTPEEINMLLNFFLPYAYCLKCSEIQSTSSESLSDITYSICECPVDEKEKKLIDTVKEVIESDIKDNEESNEINTIQTDSCGCESKSAEESESNTKKDEIQFKSKFTCDKGHVLEIQTADVTHAIKDIVIKYNENEQKNNISFEDKLGENKVTISRNLTEEDVKNFWSQYRDIIDKDKEKLWETILMALNKYHEVLQEGYEMSTKIDNLKKQNAELERLLESQKTCPETALPFLPLKPIRNVPYKLKMK
ncbi:PREDICTED: dynein regulatory complex protein 1 [Ceratosolen solmsi marchali]|uniref:Dynein regulatory complex protein 1 n=1 Tax=Ceratosolen solmsi marchali TaxID=326594 RepID=A0AAJ6VKB0_9HYME|nr:PREDICTED: dynein regulatory complex protein 1 [Ceratosolen solmsi marchali]